MSIGTIEVQQRANVDNLLNARVDVIKFTGDATYPDGGTSGIEATIRAGIGREVTLIAIMPQDCGVYRPVLTETPASVKTVATYPTADQVGNTILYKLDGGAEQTVTLAGAHTTAAHLAASMNAEAGLHAYEDSDGQCIVKTDDVGPDATLQITGGTANTAYAFPTTLNTGSTAKLLKVLTEAFVDAGANVASTDLSGTTFEIAVLSK
jgi:hypothetical protein